MQRTIDVTHSRSNKRLGLLSAPALLGFALAVSACSSDGPASRTAATVTTAAPIEATPVITASTPAPAVTTPTTTEAAVATTDTASGSTPGTESNDIAVEAFLDELKTRGFDGVVAVRKGDDITTRAYGVADRENDVAIEAETVFDIGSVTKQFTAAAILRLEMDGRLSVDDTLGEHVPGLPAEKAAITLHQLLTHTAGVVNNVGFDDEPIDRSDFLARVADTPLVAEPGDHYAYSNVGYALLAAVVEFETGGPYEAYLRTALFEPAGMLDTGYVLPDWDDRRVAVGYIDPSGDRFGRPNERPWNVDGPYWNLHGNGGLLSTAADMLRWDQALLGDEVLDATAIAKFFAPHVPVSPGADISYAYGWQIVPMPMGTPLVMHNGTNEVFYTDFLRFVDQDLTVFIVTNSFEIDDADVASDLANHALGGQLTATSEADTGTAGDSDWDPDAVPVNCGFPGLSIESMPDYSEVDALPDSVSGRTAETFVELLANGDAAARRDFAARYIAEELGGDDVTVIANEVAGLQEMFAGHQVTSILEQDDRRFHLLMRGPEADLLLSLGFDDADPERLACLAVSD